MSETQRPNFMPVIIGMALTCVLLAALGYVANRRGKVRHEPPPSLSVITPTTGMAVDSPVLVRFTTGQQLDLRASGWGHDTYHLHAVVNGVEIMPAAADIVPADSAIYAWTLSGVSRGSTTIYLAWADHAHRPLRQGASDTIQVTIR
jgi:hypothetical protein